MNLTKSINLLLSITWNLRMSLIGKLIEWSVPVLGAFFRAKPWPLSMEQMRHLPEGSLGRETIQTLDAQGFKLISKYESHDTKHVLLGYSMTGVGEIRLQFCQLGNGNRSLATLGIVILGILILPELWEQFRTDWKRGNQISPLHQVDFGAELGESVNTLRLRFGIK